VFLDTSAAAAVSPLLTMRKPIHPLWGIVEVAGFTTFVFAILWILGPAIATRQEAGFAFWPLILAGGVYVLWASPVVLHRDPPEWRGLGGRAQDGSRPGSFRNAWQAYAVFTAGAAVLLIIYVAWLNPARLAEINWKAVLVRLVEYVGSGIAQAAIFQGFIANRIRAAIPLGAGRRSVRLHRLWVALATMVLFGLYHWPNLPLIAFVLPAGFCWTWIFLRRPNLLLLGLSHAVLGTILNRVVLLPMRIGPFYAHPDLYLWRTVIPGLKDMIGNLY
jgi:membrane protease YdiL (CAAX protease family)